MNPRGVHGLELGHARGYERGRRHARRTDVAERDFHDANHPTVDRLNVLLLGGNCIPECRTETPARQPPRQWPVESLSSTAPHDASTFILSGYV